MAIYETTVHISSWHILKPTQPAADPTIPQLKKHVKKEQSFGLSVPGPQLKEFFPISRVPARYNGSAQPRVKHKKAVVF